MALNLTSDFADNDTRFEPQRSNHGVLRFIGVNFGGIKQSVLELSTKTFPVPKSQQNQSEIQYVNETRYYPGKRTYDPMSVTFNDYIDLQTAKLLHLWYNAVQSPLTGAIGLKANIAKRCEVVLFAPDGSRQRPYLVTGIWPQSLDPGDVDYTSDEPIIMTVNFVIDKIIPQGPLLLDNASGGQQFPIPGDVVGAVNFGAAASVNATF